MCRDGEHSYTKNKEKLLELLEDFSGGPDLEENCIDAILVILHYAQGQNQDVQALVRMVRTHFNAETGGSI